MSRIKKVEPNKWYSVKVKPPKERKWYLCQFESDLMEVTEWTDEYEGDGCFMWEYDDFILGRMVAWRELPEKYRGEVIVNKTIQNKLYHKSNFCFVLFTDGTLMEAYATVKAVKDGKLTLTNGKLIKYRYGYTIKTDAPVKKLKESDIQYDEYNQIIGLNL